MQSDQLWLIQFYAPWDDYDFECEACADFAAHWESAAGLLRGFVKLGVVDAVTPGRFGRKLASRFIGREKMDNLSAYPRIIVFGYDKTNPIVYSEGTDQDEKEGGPTRPLLSFALNQIGHMITRRVSAGSYEQKKTDEEKLNEYLFSMEEVSRKHPNIQLTSRDTFGNDVMNFPISLVVILAAWDVNSKVFLDDVVEASYVLQNSGVGFFIMEGSTEPALLSKFKISDIPNVVTFKYSLKPGMNTTANDKDDDRTYMEFGYYEGALNSKELTAHSYELVDNFLDLDAQELAMYPPLQMGTPHLTSPQMFRDTCTITDDKNGRYCVLIVLPALSDDNKSEVRRKSYLSTVRKVQKKLSRAANIRTQFLWSEWGAQPQLEKTLGIKDLPATLVLHLDNNEYLIQAPEKNKNGGFTINGITRFVKMATGGRMQKKMKEIDEGEADGHVLMDLVNTLETEEEKSEKEDSSVPNKDEL